MIMLLAVMVETHTYSAGSLQIRLWSPRRAPVAEKMAKSDGDAIEMEAKMAVSLLHRSCTARDRAGSRSDNSVAFSLRYALLTISAAHDLTELGLKGSEGNLSRVTVIASMYVECNIRQLLDCFLIRDNMNEVDETDYMKAA